MAPKPDLWYTIRARIREYRLQRNMSQEDLAKCVGLSRTSIVNIENGNQSCPLHTLWRISVALNCWLRDLLPRKGMI